MVSTAVSPTMVGFSSLFISTSCHLELALAPVYINFLKAFFLISLPLEVVGAAFSHPVMHDTHGLNDLSLHLLTAGNVKVCQEVVSHCDKRLFGPALEPVHCTAGDQARKLQGSAAELLPNLDTNTGIFNK